MHRELYRFAEESLQAAATIDHIRKNPEYRISAPISNLQQRLREAIPADMVSLGDARALDLDVILVVVRCLKAMNICPVTVRDLASAVGGVVRRLDLVACRIAGASESEAMLQFCLRLSRESLNQTNRQPYCLAQ